ncbi:MAG: CCA tRNA nucleotidyltransferase [Candidatus Methanoperedens sp.]|nr:CCA tRNA nucleotidyltransferase [Candidatus Methanoperedens sp.]
MNDLIKNRIDTNRRSVLLRIKPGDEERIKLNSIAGSLIGQINEIGKNEGISGQLVGSTARRTWLSGEHDLDIFIMFPPEKERKYLEEKGLDIARKIAQGADCFEERYAEHPYINAVFSGFEVDLVPAFSVPYASEIKSAVDRTPFHNAFVLKKIAGLEDEVLLLKQFMKGIGVYGSELRKRGFSGYLAELLVINFGSFMNVLDAACGWKGRITIDIEKHGTLAHNDPMVMIDPTDPARNVAAVLSLDNLCTFIDRACEFLKNPDERYFTLHIPEPLDNVEFQRFLKTRGSSLIAVEFHAPDEVDDVLYPQLYKMEESISQVLEKFDFRVYNSGVWAARKAVVIFEIESARLPYVKRHTGPEIGFREHIDAFKSKYKDSNVFSRIYIRNGRYMVDIQRKYYNAKGLMLSELPKCGLGKHISMSIKEGYKVLENEEILAIENEDFRRFLRSFFIK